MSTFHQLPTVSGAHAAEMTTGRAMGWLGLLFGAAWPRLVIVAFWLFSDLLGDAYDGWVVPVAGFVLLPWTTMTYALMWGLSSSAVTGAEWVAVVAAVLLDLLTWVAARALR
jgi:hypothetical protein